MLAIGSIWRGIAYLMPEGSPYAPSVHGGVVEVLALGGPPWVLGVGWLIAGGIALVSLARKRWIVGTTVVGAAWLTWGLAYLIAWILPGYGQPTDWISAGTYLPTAGIILGALLIREPVVLENGKEG